MKRAIYYTLSLILAGVFSIFLSSCSTSDNDVQEALTPQVSPPVIVQEGTLKVGIQTDDAPFAAMSEDKIVGYEADIARAVAAKLGLTVTFVDIERASVSEALESGALDIVMGATNKDLSTSIWISDPYGYSGIALFAVPNTSAPSANDKLSIAAQSGAKGAWVAEHTYKDAIISEYDALEEVLKSVVQGNQTYAAVDIAAGMYAAKTLSLDVENVVMLEKATSRSIAVNANNSELTDAISSALTSLVSDGVVSAYGDQWFGRDLAQITLQTFDLSAHGDEQDKPLHGDSSASSDERSSSEDNLVLQTAGANAILEDGYTKAIDAGLAVSLHSSSLAVGDELDTESNDVSGSTYEMEYTYE